MPLSARMRLPAACLAAAVALPVAFAGPLPALAQATAQPKTQPKPAAQPTAADRASALLRGGRAAQALAVLRPAVEARPNDLRLLFLVGRAGLAAAGRRGIDEKTRDAFLDAAIAALRRMLTIRPGLMRARLELARAFFLKGEDTLARRHFERVLAGKPPAPVVANVNRYLGAIRARKRWSGYFGFAWRRTPISARPPAPIRSGCRRSAPSCRSGSTTNPGRPPASGCWCGAAANISNRCLTCGAGPCAYAWAETSGARNTPIRASTAC